MPEKTKGFFAEFREFIARGNVMDMAVGVIIGAAFKAIIDALVNNILNPIICAVANTGSIADLSVRVNGTYLTYGVFLSAVLNFLIVALVLFCLVRAMNRFRKKEAAAPPAPPEPSAEEKLLTEIRDLLRQGK